MIIGITGTLGAGKGTVVEYLRQQGFSHYSSSDTLRHVLAERGKPIDREHMSMLANELSNQQDGGVLQDSHRLAQANKHENCILEALHRVSEGEYIKKIGGTILGVDADIKVRYDRVSARGDSAKDNVSFEQFVIDSDREDEGKTGSGPNIRAVINMADHTIHNDGTIEELHQKVEQWLQTLTTKK
jgi:dephospho-CoA kinase